MTVKWGDFYCLSTFEWNPGYSSLQHLHRQWETRSASPLSGADRQPRTVYLELYIVDGAVVR